MERSERNRTASRENKVESKVEHSIFENFMDLIEEVQVFRRQIPTLGKLIKTTPNYITLERKNGSSTVINKKVILQIQPTTNQPGVV
jgi:hypothetical protein